MLVSAATLSEHLDDPTWTIFDCRHDLNDHERGARLYTEGHIPGAHFVAVETDLSGSKTGSNGRHPLPEPAAFVEFLARHGVSAQSTVVAYDDSGGLYAARLWWMARWIGLTSAVLLDGGLPRWVSEGRELTTKVPKAERTALVVDVDSSHLWTAGDVLRNLQDPETALLDARTAERYRGEAEPIDPFAGHIPGALNRFYKQNLNADLTFREASELQREFGALLGDKRPENVVHYCGSGITACANFFAMEYAGLTGSKLYNGSWSEWLADPTLPTVPPRVAG